MRLGALEILVILGVILLFFGPSRLPSLGNALGSALRGFKKGVSGQEDGDPALPRAGKAPSEPKA